MTNPQNKEGIWRIPLGCAISLFAGVVLYRLYIVWFGGSELFIATLPDDAWYYIAIARHIATGVGSTFDGIHPTNGYHPLWMMLAATTRLIVGGAASADGDVLRFARILLTLQIILGVAAATMQSILCARILKSWGAAALMVALYATPFAIYGMTDGMESGVLLMTIAALFWAAVKFRPFADTSASVGHLAFGAVLSMAVLARLDFILILPAMALVLAARGFRKNLTGTLKLIGVISFPVIVTLALYVLMNAQHFDTVFPISTILKSSFPHPHLNVKALTEHIVPISAGIAAIALGLIGPKTRDGKEMREDTETTTQNEVLLGTGTVFICFHLLHTIFFTRWGIQRWHFTAYWPFLFWQIVFLFSIRQRWHGALIALIGAGSIAVQWRFLLHRQDRAFQVQSYKAAEWARSHFPATRIIGMSDCGAFGAFRGGAVVNLDGVVNNLAFQEALKTRGIRAYAEEEAISYIAHHAIDEATVSPGYGTFVYTAHTYLYDKDSMLLLKERDEVYRSAPYVDGTGAKRFVIWKRHADLSLHTPIN